MPSRGFVEVAAEGEEVGGSFLMKGIIGVKWPLFKYHSGTPGFWRRPSCFIYTTAVVGSIVL